MKKISQLIISGIILSSCAFNHSDTKNINDQKFAEDRQKLTESYSTIKGTYSGTLNDGEKKYPVELALYTLEEKAGSDSNGETIIRPVLYAKYRRLDIVVADAVLNARYLPESGDLILTNPNTKNSDDIQSINARISGSSISGQVNQLKGILGEIQLTLSNKEVNSDNQGDQNAINERLRNQLKKVEGLYEGEVEPPAGVADKFPIRLVLFVADVTSNGIATPTLMGNYKRIDDVDGITELNMIANYKPETTPAQLIVQSSQANRSLLYTVTLNGVIVDEQISGSFFTQKGYMGTFKLNLKK